MQNSNSTFQKYTWFNPNGSEAVRFVNMAHAVDVYCQMTEDGSAIKAIQILTLAPTHQVIRAVPDKAKVDRDGKLLVNKQGYQLITYVKKTETEHVIVTIMKEEDMRNILAYLDQNPDDYKYVSHTETLSLEGNEAFIGYSQVKDIPEDATDAELDEPSDN